MLATLMWQYRQLSNLIEKFQQVLQVETILRAGYKEMSLRILQAMKLITAFQNDQQILWEYIMQYMDQPHPVHTFDEVFLPSLQPIVKLRDVWMVSSVDTHSEPFSVEEVIHVGMLCAATCNSMYEMWGTMYQRHERSILCVFRKPNAGPYVIYEVNTDANYCTVFLRR